MLCLVWLYFEADTDNNFQPYRGKSLNSLQITDFRHITTLTVPHSLTLSGPQSHRVLHL